MAELTEKRYPVLRVIVNLYRVLAWIVVILGVVACVVFTSMAKMVSDPVTSILWALVAIVGDGILFIALLSISESIMVFIDIEENTRDTKELLSKKQLQDGKIEESKDKKSEKDETAFIKPNTCKKCKHGLLEKEWEFLCQKDGLHHHLSLFPDEGCENFEIKSKQNFQEPQVPEKSVDSVYTRKKKSQVVDKKKCPKCQKTIPIAAEICPYCGVKLNT
ncbi:MAG: hypothetical protein HY769_04620 [Candidatus Stahlbacteria bacterium]|nr:hypothetical protein [Candidatus Stahlbacteria bacterium]